MIFRISNEYSMVYCFISATSKKTRVALVFIKQYNYLY